MVKNKETNEITNSDDIIKKIEYLFIKEMTKDKKIIKNKEIIKNNKPNDIIKTIKSALLDKSNENMDKIRKLEKNDSKSLKCYKKLTHQK